MIILLKDLIKNTQLPIGTHNVKITSLMEGNAENTGTPFFQCTFENSDGFFINRFYNDDQYLYTIIKLFKSCNIEICNVTTLDTIDLLHKELEISIVEDTFTNESTGKMKKIRRIVDFNLFNTKKFQDEEKKKYEAVQIIDLREKTYRSVIGDNNDDTPLPPELSWT